MGWREREESLFNKWFGTNWISTCQKMKLDSYLISFTKINPKWITDNVRAKTINILEEI